MTTVNLDHDGLTDLTVEVNGHAVWSSTTETHTTEQCQDTVPLPGSAGADPDLTTALTDLTNRYGIVAVQNMIRTIRHNDNGPVISGYLAAEAAAAIAALMKRNPQLSYQDARSRVGDVWGYKGTSKTNFYKIADSGWMNTQSGAA